MPERSASSLEEIESRYLFRRLRTKDTGELERLCGDDDQWKDHFPNHRLWLSKAIEELSRPGRAAIGAFESYWTELGALATRLEGCLFLKLSDYDDSAELKNLVLSKSHEAQVNKHVLLRSLVSKAIRYCEIHEVGRLEFEAPQTEHSLISIFLESGFRVASIRERYFPGKELCLLEKLVGEKYTGDPFDLVSLGTWVMLAIFPCRLISKSLVLINNADGPVRLAFEVSPLHPAFSDPKSTGYKQRLTASLVILEDPWNDDETVTALAQRPSEQVRPLQYVLARDPLSGHAHDLLRAAGINLLEWEDIKTIAGGGESSLSIPMDAGDIGGVLTVLEHELIEVYKSYPEGFVYYLLSGLGAVLNKPDSTDAPESPELRRLLAVYCPHWIDGKKGIIAVAEIVEIGRAPIGQAFELFGNTPGPITRQDLNYYHTKGDTDDIPVLRCERLRLFDRVLEFGSSEWDHHPQMQDYLTRELKSPVNSVYLDYVTADMLRKHALPGAQDSRKDTDNSTSSIKTSERELGRIEIDKLISYARARVKKSSFRRWAGGDRIALSIVFTDIVGSTALGVRVGDERMRKIRRAHFDQSRSLIKANGGIEIKTVGDAFMAVFRSADSALDFARALHRETGSLEVQIRAGIHAGEIDVEGEDAFGTEVNFAARVVSAFKGAEIWVSSEVKHRLEVLKADRHSSLLWDRHDGVLMSGFAERATLWSLKVS